MKNILMFLSLSCFIGSVYAQQVPASWYKYDPIAENSSSLNKSDDEEEEKFGNYLHDLSETTQTFLDQMETENGEKSNSSWHFNEYRPQYGISVYGLLGIVGLKATSAIEQRWVKKTAKPKSNESDLSEVDNNETLIDSEKSDEEVLQTFEPFIEKAAAKGLISKGDARNQLLGKINEIRDVIESLATYKEENKEKAATQWLPTTLRIDFSVGANAKIFTIAHVGAEFRLRTLWKIPDSLFINKDNSRKSSLNGESQESLHELVNNLNEDMTEAYEESIGEETGSHDKGLHNPFELESVGVGIGAEANLKWAIAQADFKADFMVIFTKKVIKDKSLIKSSAAFVDSDYTVISAENDNTNNKSFADLFRTKRSMFRKTLRKAFTKSVYVSEKMAGKEKSNWTLEKIRVDYALQKIGFLGIAQARGKVFTEILMHIKRDEVKPKNNEKSFSDKLSLLNEAHVRSRLFTAFKLPVIEIKFFPEIDLLFLR